MYNSYVASCHLKFNYFTEAAVILHGSSLLITRGEDKTEYMEPVRVRKQKNSEPGFRHGKCLGVGQKITG